MKMTISETPWTPSSPLTLREAHDKTHCRKCYAKPGENCLWPEGHDEFGNSGDTHRIHVVRLYEYEMDYGVTNNG